MIIDCHTRMWSDSIQLGSEAAVKLAENGISNWAEECGDAAAHGRAMSCIDIALVLGHRADLAGAHVPNELIAEFTSRDPLAGLESLALTRWQTQHIKT